MKKEILAGITIVLISFQSYCQTDSLRPVSGDTLRKEGFPEAPGYAGQEKKSVNKKTTLYKINPAVDIPIVVAGTGWSLFTFTKIYDKGVTSEEKILGLKKSDINAFDRWAVYPYSKTLDRVSYYPFYAAIPLPLIFFATDKEVRKDYWKLTFLYWEAMAVTGLMGTTATYFVDRYRPYAYSNETPMPKRMDRISKNSFYSGHVQIVSVSTFFIAKVYSDYHPESKIKWVYYGVAAAATGATAYMRLAGGQHFPSDILLGTALGTLTGIMVPQLHKIKNPSMSVLPYNNGESQGITFTYHFHDIHKKIKS